MLSIIYRACHWETTRESVKNLSRPAWFCKKKAFRSFYNEFGDRSDVELVVVFDGNADHELAKYINQFNIDKIIYLDNAGNKESLLFCYKMLGDLRGEYVGIAEDDYLWLPGSLKALVEAAHIFGNSGTISLYNHPDRVTRTDDITLGHDYILATPSCYWRTAESNTATFLLKKDVFNKCKQEFLDCGIQDRLLFINLLKKYGLRHFTPVSEKYGCTHINQYFLSLYIDWQGFNDTIQI